MAYTVSDLRHVTRTEEEPRFQGVRMATTVVRKLLGFGVGKERKKRFCFVMLLNGTLL